MLGIEFSVCDEEDSHRLRLYQIGTFRMLVREGDERNIAIDMGLAAILSGVAGALNSAGFHALGFFSANMTGNASLLSDMLAMGRFSSAMMFGVVILAFVGGAFTATNWIESGRSRGVRAIYAYVIAAEGLAIALLGAVAFLLPSGWDDYCLFLALSFLMGLQNATTTRISNARVRTTHVSGMATDIGIGLALLRRPAGRDNPEQKGVGARLRLHGVGIASFVVGGLAGVLLYEQLGGGLLIAAGIMLLGASGYEILRASKA
ncbi:YoaK family protein [Kumtagia ephedrae]|nr:YoaK family protein [Mesorhizobium ephedrae]